MLYILVLINWTAKRLALIGITRSAPTPAEMLGALNASQATQLFNSGFNKSPLRPQQSARKIEVLYS